STAARAAEVGDPRVHVLRQANSGKSGALTRGLVAAANEVIVFLDADTQFQPDTLRLLVQPLADPRVGAVSGHARVGNLQTWIARFQSLEYICGFYIYRRRLRSAQCDHRRQRTPQRGNSGSRRPRFGY